MIELLYFESNGTHRRTSVLMFQVPIIESIRSEQSRMIISPAGKSVIRPKNMIILSIILRISIVARQWDGIWAWARTW